MRLLFLVWEAVAAMWIGASVCDFSGINGFDACRDFK